MRRMPIEEDDQEERPTQDEFRTEPSDAFGEDGELFDRSDASEARYWIWRRKKSLERQTSTFGVQRLAKSIAPLTKVATRQRGFTNARILVEWEKIIPPGMHELVRPVEIRRQAKTGEATLVVLVSSSTAAIVQHYEPQIIERVNGYFGFNAITKLQLKQGILPLPKLAKRKAAPERPAEVVPDLSAVTDDGIRAALDRLHAARYAKSRA